MTCPPSPGMGFFPFFLSILRSGFTYTHSALYIASLGSGVLPESSIVDPFHVFTAHFSRSSMKFALSLPGRAESARSSRKALVLVSLSPDGEFCTV